MPHLFASQIAELHRQSQRQLAELEKAFKSEAWVAGLARAPSHAQEPQIPHPKLFQTIQETAASRNPPQEETQDSISGEANGSLMLGLPTVAECAVHLELLEIFSALRFRIVNSTHLDEVFGVEEKKRTVYRSQTAMRNGRWTYVKNPVTLKDATWTSRRREKWIFYLHVAVGRFMAWADMIDSEARTSLEEGSLPYLPPCDVLMVWHALLLNPKNYQLYCKAHNLQRLARVSFPWATIHAAIEMRTLSYKLSDESVKWLEKHSSMAPDLYEYLCSLRGTQSCVAISLSKYGTILASRAWSSRPIFNKGQIPDLPALDRGLVESFRQASLDATQASALVANVQRQASFVDKMHRHLWIRSPAVEGTMRRAVERYGKFLEMFRLKPRSTLVPTLDVDLVWHTHQLSPLQYRADVGARAGRFVNHDDKLAKTVLDDGMETTAELFRLSFGQSYLYCLCWDCEALTSAMEMVRGDDGPDADIVWSRRAREAVECCRVVELDRREGRGEPLPVHLCGPSPDPKGSPFCVHVE